MLSSLRVCLFAWLCVLAAGLLQAQPRKVLVLSPSAFFPGSALSANLQSLLQADGAIPAGSTVTYRDIFQSGPDTNPANQWVTSLLGAYYHPDVRQGHIDAIRNGGYTHVVLIDRPFFSAVAPEAHIDAVDAWAKVIRSAGAQPLLLLPWTNSTSLPVVAHDYYWFRGQFGQTFTISQATIRENTFRVGAGTNVPVVPAGTAWSNLASGNQGTFATTTGTGLTSGGVDVNANGAYTAAATLYTSLTGRNAKTISFTPSGLTTTVRNAIADAAAIAVSTEAATVFASAYQSRYMPMLSDPGEIVASGLKDSSTEGTIRDMLVNLGQKDGRTASKYAHPVNTEPYAQQFIDNGMNVMIGRIGAYLTTGPFYASQFYNPNTVPTPPTRLTSLLDRPVDNTAMPDLLRQTEWQTMFLYLTANFSGHQITPLHLFAAKTWYETRVKIYQDGHAPDWIFYGCAMSLYARRTNGAYGMNPAAIDYVSTWRDQTEVLRYAPLVAPVIWQATLRMSTLSAPPATIPERPYGLDRIIDAELAHGLSGPVITDNPEVLAPDMAQNAPSVLQPTTKSLTSIQNGHWARFKVRFPSSAPIALAAFFQVSSTRSDATIEVRDGGPSGTLLGTAKVTNTGSFTQFARVAAIMNTAGLTGDRDIYLGFRGGSGDLLALDYWRFSVIASAGENVWISSAGGSWGDASKWLPSIPNSTAVAAKFSTDIPGELGSPTAVTLDGNRTVASLTVGHGTGVGSVSLLPGTGGTLTLNKGNSNGVSILKAGGSQNDRVGVPVFTTTTLDIRNSSPDGGRLEIAAPINTNGQRVLVNGGVDFSGTGHAYGWFGSSQSVGSINGLTTWNATGTVVNFYLKLFNVFTLNGGSLTNAGWTELGNDEAGFNGDATFDLNGGTFAHTNAAQTLWVARRNQSGTIFINFNGGVFETAAPFTHPTTTSAILTFNGGILRYTNPTTDASPLLPASLTTRIGVSPARFDVVTAGRSATLADALAPLGSNDGGLEKLGAGRLLLSGTNTFSGPVVVTGGTLSANSSSAFGAARAFSVASGGTLDVGGLPAATLALSGTGAQLSGAGTIQGGVSLSGGVINSTSLASPLTVTGALSISNATLTIPIGTSGMAVLAQGPLTLSGTLNVSLSASNQPTAAGTSLTLFQGSTRSGTFTTASAPFGWTFNYSSNALALVAEKNIPAVSQATPPNGGAATWGVPVVLSATALDIGGVAMVEFLINGVKVGDGVPQGSGVYTLSWTPVAVGAQNVTVRVTNTQGVSVLTTGQIYQVAAVNNGPVTWINAAGGLWSTGANWQGGVPADGTREALFNSLDLTANATVDLGSSGDRTLAALRFGDTASGSAAGWKITGTSKLVLTGGAAVIETGALGAGAVSEIAAPITAVAGFEKTGPGQLLLSGNLSGVADSVRHSAGTLAFNTAPGTTRVISQAIAISGNGTMIDAYSTGTSGTATISLAGGVTGTGTGTLWLQTQPNASLRLDSAVSHPAGELRLSTNGAAVVEIRSSLDVATLGVLNQFTGSATMRFGNGANVNATTQIAGRNGSRFLTFQVQSGANVSTPLFAGASNDIFQLDGGVFAVGQITFGGNGKLTGNGGELRALANQATWITGTGGNNLIQAQGGGLRFNTNGYNVGLPQRILTNTNPDGGLTKLGAGTLTLSAAVASPNITMTWRGPTVVSAGTLRFATGSGPSVNSTSYTIAADATLDLSALATPTLTLPANGTLTGSGTIQGNLAYAAGTAQTTTLTAGSPISVTGSATLGGNLAISGSLPVVAGQYHLLVAGSVSGSFANETSVNTTLAAGLAAGWTRTLQKDGTRVFIQVTAPASPSENWRTTNAPGQAWDSDVDNDGWLLVQEYALGGNVNGSDAGSMSAALTTVSNESRLQIRFRYNTTASDVLIEVQTSPDLVTWTTILNKPLGQTTQWGVNAAGSTLENTGAPIGTVQPVQATSGSALGQRGFIRVRVSR